jgi:hypothetical protein
MVLLHDKNLVGPTDMLSRDADPRVMICACRAYLIKRVTRQELLGRKAADPVLAADEQQLLKLGHALCWHPCNARRQRKAGCAPDDLQINCRATSAPAQTYASFPAAPEGAARAELCAHPACRLHALVRAQPPQDAAGRPGGWFALAWSQHGRSSQERLGNSRSHRRSSTSAR